MWCIILAYIAVPNFKRIWPNLGELWPKNSQKSIQKWYFWLVGKHLKIDNFPTTNATPMKLIRILYLYESFIGASPIGRRRAWSKNLRKLAKKWVFLVNFLNFQGHIKNSNSWDVLPYTASLGKVSKESDRIWGSYGQKTTQKQPANVVFATKTFENS